MFSPWEWLCNPSNAGQVLTKYSIVGFLQQATEICLNKPNLIPNGFRRSGICPFDPNAPNRNKLLPATIFDEPGSPSLPGPSSVVSPDTSLTSVAVETPSLPGPSYVVSPDTSMTPVAVEVLTLPGPSIVVSPDNSMNPVAVEPPRFVMSISFGIVESQEVSSGLVHEFQDDSNMNTSLMPLQEISIMSSSA